MLHVSIVGDRGSGRTTVLGLLYAALVRSGSDKTDDLRFHATYESLEEVTVLFQRLMSGGFPDAATKEGMHEFGFSLAFRRPKRGAFLSFGSRKWTADASTSVHVTLPGSLDEQIPGILQGSSTGRGAWRDAMDADVVIVLADSTKLAPKAEDSDPRRMDAYDRQVESLFTSIQRWRSRGGRNVLHPIFVLSKFDSVRPEALKAADLEPTPPDVSKPGPRAAYAKALLEPNLPRTLATVEEAGGKGFRFGRPSYFFSGVRTEAKAPRQSEGIRLRRIDGGGWEPDYSRDEYLALLECLADIASRAKD